MKALCRAALIASAFAFCLPIGSTAAAVDVVIPEGTSVLTHLDEPLSSKDVHTGDVFRFVVGENVVVGNYIAIPLGAKGVGHVTEAHSAGSHGKSGGIRLAFDYVFAADGSSIPVAHNKSAEEKDRSTLGATALGVILTGGLGLFFHNFVHGSDVTIPADAKTYVVTLAPKKVAVDENSGLNPAAQVPVTAHDPSSTPAADAKTASASEPQQH